MRRPSSVEVYEISLTPISLDQSRVKILRSVERYALRQAALPMERLPRIAPYPPEARIRMRPLTTPSCRRSKSAATKEVRDGLVETLTATTVKARRQLQAHFTSEAEQGHHPSSSSMADWNQMAVMAIDLLSQVLALLFGGPQFAARFLMSNLLLRGWTSFGRTVARNSFALAMLFGADERGVEGDGDKEEGEVDRPPSPESIPMGTGHCRSVKTLRGLKRSRTF